MPSGQLLEGYELQRVLSSGRYGLKYSALDREKGQTLAIREYLPEGMALRQEQTVVPRSEDVKALFDAGLTRFFDLGRAQSRIHHPNMATVQKWFQANGTGYVVMDYVEGETLASLLESRNVLPEEELRRIVQGILPPLEDLHDIGFLHQDIRPGNIVVRADGSPLLLEPGLGSQTGGSARQTFGGQAKGFDLSAPAAGYAPLEQYSSRLRLGYWTDIYSLGALMYHCATGQPPPDAPSRAVQDELAATAEAAQGRYDDRMLAAIDAALALLPGGRPSSIAAWRATFIDEEEAEPADAARPGHMARGATRVAARGFARPAPRPTTRAAPRARRIARGVQPRAAARSSEPRRGTAHWMLPTAAALAITALLTYVDVGILRSERKSASSATEIAARSEPAPAAEAADSRQGEMPAPPTPSEMPAEAPLGARASGPQALVEPAETPAEAPATDLAGLVVLTEPEGAEVLLGEQSLGLTPLELADLSPGEYDFRLVHPWYETLEVPGQSLRPGGSARIERTLTRATGELRVETEPPGAWIERDGERLAEITPATLQGLPAGPLQLRLGLDGYASAEVEAQVPKDGSNALQFALEVGIALGTLTLSLAPEGAAVTLPDLETPYSPGMQIPEGPHRIQLSAAGYRSETRTLEVAGDAQFDIALIPELQPFTLAVTPAQAAVRILGGEPYAPGMPLPPGTYRVRAALAGYQVWEEDLEHGAAPSLRQVELEPGIGEFSDPLASGGNGPTMVLIPAGAFRMGCLSDEAECRENEGPTREVAIAQPFALSKYELTFQEYDRFVDATGHPPATIPEGWPRGNQPAANVSWEDAAAYAQWLSAETGRNYRLPSEAEWEYAARAGSDTAYSWGNGIGSGQAACNGCGSDWDNQRPAPSGSFDPNPWGLHDMHGNLWEWVQDCQSDDYRGAPADGAARADGDCQQRMLRGGAWSSSPEVLRAATREWSDRALRTSVVGFRLALAEQAGETGAAQAAQQAPAEPEAAPAGPEAASAEPEAPGD